MVVKPFKALERKRRCKVTELFSSVALAWRLGLGWGCSGLLGVLTSLVAAVELALAGECECGPRTAQPRTAQLSLAPKTRC